ncbi:MAG: response regulator, partial [Candidatus Electrothrix sp. ATG1]|nr:response regulator [Candidatus Electrothrix sp. ATG1]
LIEDILDLSKIEAGKIEMESLTFDPGELISGTAEMLRIEAENKGLCLSCAITDNIPRSVQGDPTRLCQVITNLVNNAIKFTDQGEIAIEVSLEEETESQVVLIFSVKDTGIGIPSDRFEDLFKPFSQIDPSTTRKYGGTGLGLAISSSIIEMMDGTFRVESSPGKGSTFYCTVRLEKAGPNEQHLNAEVTEEQKNNMLNTSLAGLRCLLAEDNLFNQKLGQILLEKLGISVQTVSNGKEAVEEVRKEEYDFVLMDVQMPVMDGLEATRILKKEQNTVPIIALTANATAKDRADCLAAGMDAYLSKPIDDEKLRETIFRQAGRQGASC